MRPLAGNWRGQWRGAVGVTALRQARGQRKQVGAAAGRRFGPVRVVASRVSQLLGIGREAGVRNERASVGSGALDSLRANGIRRSGLGGDVEGRASRGGVTW